MAEAPPDIDVVVNTNTSPTAKSIGIQIAFFFGSAAAGFALAWVTMRLLNRRHISKLTADYNYISVADISQGSEQQAKRAFFNGASTVAGGKVQTNSTGTGGWRAFDNTFTFENPIYDTDCDENGMYGCTSFNPADPGAYNCVSETHQEYCRTVWSNNQAWWGIYNTEKQTAAIPGTICKDPDGKDIDCASKRPYGQELAKCYYDIEYQRANPDCKTFIKTWCAGVEAALGCVYSTALPIPADVNWDGLASGQYAECEVDAAGAHWYRNRYGKHLVRIMLSPSVYVVHPDLPTQGCYGKSGIDADNPNCRMGQTPVKAFCAVEYTNTSAKTVKAYGYYFGAYQDLGIFCIAFGWEACTPPLPVGHFSVNFPHKNGCNADTTGNCDPPPMEVTAYKSSNGFKPQKNRMYNRQSTLRSGGQA